MRKYAYGSKVRTRWNTGDVATATADTASGVLAGVGTGAMIGTVAGLPGMLVGGIVGGVAGLIKGIAGSSSKASTRAKLLEQNRQQTIQNMDAKIMQDSNMPEYKPSTNFYRRGGFIKLSHDGSFASGPSHENGGVPLIPGHEVEGGETTMKDKDELLIFSDRLPFNNKMTFADASVPLFRRKGMLESKFESNEKDIENDLKTFDKLNTSAISKGTARRRAQIKAMSSEQILNEIGELNTGLKSLFNAQEASKEGMQETTMHWDGGSVWGTDWNMNQAKDRFNFQNNKFMPRFDNDVLNIVPDGFKTLSRPINSAPVVETMSGLNKSQKTQIAASFGADMLDTASQAITSYQMSKLPLPNRRLNPRMRLNSQYDNSAEVADINTSFKATQKMVLDNVRNPSVRRAVMANLMVGRNNSIGKSFANKFNIERDIENKNVELAYRNIVNNNDMSFQNSVDSYNRSMRGYERTSQISANFADKINNTFVRKAQAEYNNQSLALILSQLPQGVRNTVLQAMNR
jgi:hypothetical protein